MTTVLPRHRRLERVALTCPLGVRFVDAATNTFVENGLSVEAFSAVNPHRRVTAVRTTQGAYAFHGLPGLREFEHGVDDEGRWSPPPPTRRFVVEVRDDEQRFLSCRFEAAAPHRGLFEVMSLGSPPLSAAGAISLFSAPARPIPGGFAVVRAQLSEWRGERPAAWALAEVSLRMARRILVARGLADERGQLAVIVPWPEPANVSLGSPPGGRPQLMSEQSWLVQFRVWHTFDVEPGKLADLDRARALLQQSPDDVWDAGSPPAPFTQAQLTFGRELVVPVREPGDSRPRELLITPAGSPP